MSRAVAVGGGSGRCDYFKAAGAIAEGIAAGAEVFATSCQPAGWIRPGQPSYTAVLPSGTSAEGLTRLQLRLVMCATAFRYYKGTIWTDRVGRGQRSAIDRPDHASTTARGGWSAAYSRWVYSSCWSPSWRCTNTQRPRTVNPGCCCVWGHPCRAMARRTLAMRLTLTRRLLEQADTA